MIKIAVFASHNGSDLQAIIDACAEKRIEASVCAVISNNADAFALKRASSAGINTYTVNKTLFPDNDGHDAEILRILRENKADMIFLTGYLKLLGQPVLEKYGGRIYNIHPALLPKYGGKGMYGLNVHKAVIGNGEKITGVTIHRVNAVYDEGEIIASTEVPVKKNDTPETLAARVLEREHTFIVEVLDGIIKNMRGVKNEKRI